MGGYFDSFIYAGGVRVTPTGRLEYTQGREFKYLLDNLGEIPPNSLFVTGYKETKKCLFIVASPNKNIDVREMDNIFSTPKKCRLEVIVMEDYSRVYVERPTQKGEINRHVDVDYSQNKMREFLIKKEVTMEQAIKKKDDKSFLQYLQSLNRGDSFWNADTYKEVGQTALLGLFEISEGLYDLTSCVPKACVVTGKYAVKAAKFPFEAKPEKAKA